MQNVKERESSQITSQILYTLHPQWDSPGLEAQTLILSPNPGVYRGLVVKILLPPAQPAHLKIGSNISGGLKSRALCFALLSQLPPFPPPFPAEILHQVWPPLRAGFETPWAEVKNSFHQAPAPVLGSDDN